MMEPATLPVRIRVGDHREYDVGTIRPVVHFPPGPPGIARARVDVTGPLAELLREMADELLRCHTRSDAAGMTFSYSAGGTKTQTLESLGAQSEHAHDSHARQVFDLLHSMIEAGPSEHTAHDDQVYDVVYSVSASGHSSAGHDTPSLYVTLACSLKLREPEPEPLPPGQYAEEQGGPADAHAPHGGY
jgi:hypothetical protein